MSDGVLTQDEIDQIIADVLSAQGDAEATRVAAVVAGRVCACCDAPLPEGSGVRECAECASIITED